MRVREFGIPLYLITKDLRDACENNFYSVCVYDRANKASSC